MATQVFTKQFLSAASKWYKGSISKELNKMGLRYEDLLITERPEVGEALQLADKDVLTGRMRRLKRASDLTYKGKELQDYAPNMKLEPFSSEIWGDVEKIKKRTEEELLLDLHKS